MRNELILRRGKRLLAALVAALAIAACSSSPDPSASDAGDAGESEPAESFEFEIGLIDEDTGEFEPLTSQDTVEIVVGFQGLIFIEVTLRGPHGLPDRLSGLAEIAFDEPSYDFSFRDNFVSFDEPAGDYAMQRAFRVPFGQDVALLDGRNLTLSLQLSASGWRGDGEASFQIVDDEPCYEDIDGEIRCE